MNMKPSLRLSFADMWGYSSRKFNPETSYFFKSLSLRFNINLVSNNSDVHIFSCFGKNSLNIQSDLYIFFSGESPRNTNISVANYIQFETNKVFASLGCTQVSKVHYWLPLWALYIDWFHDGIHRSIYDDPAYLINPDLLLNRKIVHNKPRKFCNFIYSNPEKLRLYLLGELNNYRKVDCLGKLLNNVGFELKGTEFDKLAEQSLYKFSISFENSLSFDYNTEKLVHAYSMGSIPIYYGNINTDEINVNALLYWNGFSSIDSIVKEIIELDNNYDKFLEKAKQPLFVDNKYPARVSPINFASWVQELL